MTPRVLTDAELRHYHDQGYVIARGFYDAEEMALLIATAKADTALAKAAMDRRDTQGGTSKLTLWNHPGDDLYGMFARGRRLVDSMEALLGGEVYHYHSKMMLKEPRVGGAWEWHQDYGYWYNNGCLYPLLASCMIAVDGADRANGCLQVLAGSHHLGRVNHGVAGGQVGADPERVAEALKLLPLVYCEMAPGDAVFFHCNLLHRSDQNTSPRPRWSLICCYNAARNNPYKDSHHPRYTPLVKVADDAIKRLGHHPTDPAKPFILPQDDRSAEKAGEARE